jgi:FtsZ-binding cell division protein ZapB
MIALLLCTFFVSYGSDAPHDIYNTNQNNKHFIPGELNNFTKGEVEEHLSRIAVQFGVQKMLISNLKELTDSLKNIVVNQEEKIKQLEKDNNDLRIRSNELLKIIKSLGGRIDNNDRKNS